MQQHKKTNMRGNKTDEDDLDTSLDAAMIDVPTAEVVVIVSLPSGKEHLAPSTIVNVDYDDFTTFGSATSFDIEAPVVDGYLDQFSI